MRKAKQLSFIIFILMFTACVSTQYPVKKKRHRAKKKKCDCPDFGQIVKPAGKSFSYDPYSVKEAFKES